MGWRTNKRSVWGWWIWHSYQCFMPVPCPYMYVAMYAERFLTYIWLPHMPSAYLSVVVEGGAVLLLDILSSSSEKGQGVKVLVGRLFAAGHQLSLVEQLRRVTGRNRETAQRAEPNQSSVHQFSQTSPPSHSWTGSSCRTLISCQPCWLLHGGFPSPRGSPWQS